MKAVWQAERALARNAEWTVGDLFSHGFRPFFLGSAAYAVLLMTVWLGFIASTHLGGDGAWLAVRGSPYAWHAHELTLGFATAAVAGFLLTAVPNWTGALPLSGWPLAVLFCIWLAGRVAMLASAVLMEPRVCALIDLAFLPALASVAIRQLLVKPAMRNFVMIGLLALMTLANAVYHAATLDLMTVDALAAMRAVILVVAIMIAMIGGRIIPSFTHNYLNLRRYPGRMPRRHERLDSASVLSIAAFALLETTLPGSMFAGFAAAGAALVNAVRLRGWRGWATRDEPIVWVLHVGYAWLVAGLGLSAISSITGQLAPSLSYHAFAAGAAGTMILAVMTRASLGHTGRKLVAPPLAVWSYWLVTLSAAARVFAPALTDSDAALGIILSIAALAWIGAFGLFVIAYAPILAAPRLRAKGSD